MLKKTIGLDQQLYDYLLSASLREPEILLKLRQETASHPRAIMQISPEQGQFMAQGGSSNQRQHWITLESGKNSKRRISGDTLFRVRIARSMLYLLGQNVSQSLSQRVTKLISDGTKKHGKRMDHGT